MMTVRPPVRHRAARGGTSEGRGSGAVGITGTPGTGKKSVSTILAVILGMTVLDINSIARKRSTPDEDGTVEADTRSLRLELSKHSLSGVIVSGHLLADVLPSASAEFVAVIRCEPLTLKRRLSARGYPAPKVIENVEAELIGVVLDDALRAFGPGRVHEYDSTRSTPAGLARRIAGDYRAGRAQSGPWIDWTLSYDSPTRLTSLLSSPRTVPAST